MCVCVCAGVCVAVRSLISDLGRLRPRLQGIFQFGPSPTSLSLSLSLSLALFHSIVLLLGVSPSAFFCCTQPDFCRPVHFAVVSNDKENHHYCYYYYSYYSYYPSKLVFVLTLSTQLSHKPNHKRGRPLTQHQVHTRAREIAKTSAAAAARPHVFCRQPPSDATMSLFVKRDGLCS